MPWEPNVLDDGEAATAASVNDRFADAQAYINDLTSEGLRRGAFGPQHAFTPFAATGLAYSLIGDDGEHAYPRATFGAAMVYNAYGTDGSSDRTVIGNASVGGGYTGVPAEITLNGSGLKVGMANGDRCSAILVMFNVEVKRVLRVDPTQMSVVVCLQYQLDGAGTWRTIDETESFVDHPGHVLDINDNAEDIDIDIPIATLISSTVVAEHGDAAVNRVTGVRAMVTMWGTTSAAEGVTLRRWDMSLLPLHMGT